jgi:glucose-1-phosphatase
VEFIQEKHKNIIFDLGGVIVNIDYNLTKEAFKKLGVENFNALFSQSNQTKLFDEYEKGNISSIEFLEQIQNVIPFAVSQNQIIDAWNAMLLDLPDERIETLKKVSKHYRIFLLSNTNDIHIKCFLNYVKTQKHLSDFWGLFEKAYLSFQVGMRKPDAEIFEYVLHQNKLKASETLFIDDSIQHIEQAQKLSIDCHWLDVKKESIVDLFAGII